MKASLICAALMAVAVTASGAHAQTYKKTIPDSLVAKAKITEDSAAKIAMKRVPKGSIQMAELERSKGRLVYAYDLTVPGKSGAQEVMVDAMTGQVVRSFHETAAAERKEMAKDSVMASKSAAKPTPKPKKP